MVSYTTLEGIEHIRDVVIYVLRHKVPLYTKKKKYLKNSFWKLEVKYVEEDT